MPWQPTPLGIQCCVNQPHTPHTHTHTQSEGDTPKHSHIGAIYQHTPPVHLHMVWDHYTPAQRSWVGGGYTGFTLSVRPSARLSVCPSVRLSVCRRHGFRSISQICFGISLSNFICMLMVAIGRSLLLFSNFTFKMAPGGHIGFFGFQSLTLLWL